MGFGVYVSEAMVNRSLDLGLIAIETTRVYGHKFNHFHLNQILNKRDNEAQKESTRTVHIKT